MTCCSQSHHKFNFYDATTFCQHPLNYGTRARRCASLNDFSYVTFLRSNNCNLDFGMRFCDSLQSSTENNKQAESYGKAAFASSGQKSKVSLGLRALRLIINGGKLMLHKSHNRHIKCNCLSLFLFTACFKAT